MKKLTFLASMLIMAFIGFTAKAQMFDVYISGPFNDFTPDSSEWALNPDEDDETGSTLLGSFNIPAGQFKVCFEIGGFTNLVPGGEYDEDSGAYDPATSNVSVLDGENFFNGPYAITGEPKVFWEKTDWEGGMVEVMIDIFNEEVIFQIDEEIVDIWYIRGAFNDYSPAGLEKWALNPVEDENGVYSGAFNIPAGQFSFNFLSPNGMVYIPASLGSEEVEFEGNDYASQMDYAFSEEEEAYCWTNEAWQGGEIVVTVDANTGAIEITKVQNEETIVPYLAGPFNNYNPEGNSEWAIPQDPDDESTYRKRIYIPEGEFSINFTYGFGSLVPAVRDEDDELVPSDENVNVEFDFGFFFGDMTSAGLSRTYWVNEDWEGGDVEITIDMLNNMIMFSTDEPFEESWFIRGEFNDYEPAGLPEWEFVEDEGIYTGTFNVPAGEFSFNILGNFGMIFIPGSYENEEVVFVDNEFTGSIVNAFDEEEEAIYWTNSDWEGGMITVTIDPNESTINIVASPGSIEPAPDQWYLSGVFNGFNPGQNSEWALTNSADNFNYYTGVFEIPEGKFEFNLNDPSGMIYAPYNVTDDELENVTVEFEDNLFEGYTFWAWTAEGENCTWNIPNWEGGKIRVSIDVAASPEAMIFIELLESSKVDINVVDDNTVIYNLNGVRVDRNKLDKGVYIINGKKVIL